MAPQHHHWNYEEPKKWTDHFKTGPNQSPINILVTEAHSMTSTCCAGQRLSGDSRTTCDLKERQRGSSTGGDSPATSSDESLDNSVEVESQEDSSSNSIHRGHTTKPENQNTRFCVSNKKIFLGYPRYIQTMELTNTGHGWQVSLPNELTSHTLVSGPPLGDREYKLAQLHCHWGQDCDHGSEHQINGKSYAGELHFVHWNCTDFKSMEEAARHKHGLAVLAVFIQAIEGDEQNRNRHLDKICSGLKQIQRPGQKVSIKSRLDLKKLFPANRWHYASYEGSLTTPPLSEVVDWVVFLKPIQASEAQIESFRQLRCDDDQAIKLDKNCRPVQPVNGRLISIWSHHS